MAVRISESSIIKSTDLGMNKMFLFPKEIEIDNILPGDIIKIKFKPHKEMKIDGNILLIKKITFNGDTVNIVCLYAKEIEKLMDKFLIDVAGSLEEGQEYRPRYRWFDRKEVGNFYIFNSHIMRVEIYGILDCFGNMIHNGKKVRYHTRDLEAKTPKIILEI
jgi:hypothetical protein